MFPDRARFNEDRVGTVLGGRYLLRRLIGTGAAGAVYEAEEAGGPRVAVKLLLERIKGEPENLRFAREALITSSLSSANVARVLDSGFDSRSLAPYLVMELLTGEDLASVLERTGPLSAAVAVRLLLGACAGVAAAHAAGVIHRDIKPSNIFLHEGGGGELVVKVCDFGLAKQLFSDESMTESGSVIGSPAYMSPEQLGNAKRVDSRTDVWSLAMTLYEMLTGRTAFHEEQTIYTLMIAVATKDVPPIQDASPLVPAALATIIHAALQRDVEARCPSVTALSDALWPFAEGSRRLDATMFTPVKPGT